MHLAHITPALALAASAITLVPSRASAQSLDLTVRTTDVWTDYIDPALAAQATRIEVFHTCKALNRFAAILQEPGQRAREANDFENQMCKEFGRAN